MSTTLASLRLPVQQLLQEGPLRVPIITATGVVLLLVARLLGPTLVHCWPCPIHASMNDKPGAIHVLYLV